MSCHASPKDARELKSCHIFSKTEM